MSRLLIFMQSHIFINTAEGVEIVESMKRYGR